MILISVVLLQAKVYLQPIRFNFFVWKFLEILKQNYAAISNAGKSDAAFMILLIRVRLWLSAT